MLILILILLVTVAAGLSLLVAMFRDQAGSRIALIIHGVFAAVFLCLLGVNYFINHAASLLSLIFFAISALNGLTMFTLQLAKRPVPRVMAIIHVNLSAVAMMILFLS